MNFFNGILLIFSFGALLSTVRYITHEKKKENVSFGALLTTIIIGKGYKKADMPNEFPVYCGELEDQDTEDYLEFISPDILNLIK